MRTLVFILLVTGIIPALGQKGFSFKTVNGKRKVEVRYDGQLVTAYCFNDSTEKPVLFPIRTLKGITITRGYPVSPRVGERMDHPHHVGLWMNYESVNGLDFWNNSTAIAPEKKSSYGSIRHQEVVSKAITDGKAVLVTRSHWVDSQGSVLLEEETKFTFSKVNDFLVIDRTAKLTAKVPEVVFKDVKDGFLGLRVARELEMPSTQGGGFVGPDGKQVQDPIKIGEGLTGMYLNRQGTKGDDTWGKRAMWTCLTGRKDGKDILIAIIDHPKNPGSPTYWHARGYGLFAANPLGQKVFSEGKEEMNLKLLNGESVTFRFRVAVTDRLAGGSQVEELSKTFSLESGEPSK